MSAKTVEQICDAGDVLALIVRAEFSARDIEFLTPDSYSLQLGYMHRPDGYVIQPHVHLPVQRTATYTQEVLFIRSGRVRVDFYTEEKVYLESRILVGGDVILLIKGGHGFFVIEEADIIEVKQGPYKEGNDKERFEPQMGARIISLGETP